MTAPRHRPRAAIATLGLLCALVAGGRPAAAAQRPTILQDVEYASPAGVSLRLDAFIPDGDGPFPGLIALHGGGWVAGDKTEWDNNCKQLADLGFACFSVDYRLAPQYPYPAAVDDALAAVKWVRENAAEYHVDPTRLGAIGSSAGAYLAAMIGYTGKGSLDTGTRVRLVVLWSAPTDLATIWADRVDPNKAFSNASDFLGCDLTACAAKEKDASPVTYVDGSDSPTLIANSTDEQIPLTQAQELSGKLKRAGVPRQLYVVQGNNHGARLKSQFPQDGGGKSVFDLSVEFIQKWIDTGSGSGSPTPTGPGPFPTSTFDPNPVPTSGGDSLFLAVAAVGVAVVAGLIGIPLLRRRRLR